MRDLMISVTKLQAEIASHCKFRKKKISFHWQLPVLSNNWTQHKNLREADTNNLPTYKVSYDIRMTYNQCIRILFLFRISSMEILPETCLYPSPVLEKLLHENCIRNVSEIFVDDESKCLTNLLQNLLASSDQWLVEEVSERLLQ